MSASHAHAPSDHPTAPSAAPSAAPAAANSTMHFNHGGVLGLTESIARLVKGVTYDAAVDTFAHPANNPNMGAAHPTDGSHPAPHPAPHPTPAADGAHPAPHPAPHPTDGSHPAPHPAPATSHDDDEDDSISGSIIKGLSHMGHYGMAFPVLAKGLKWAKNKMFPEIHEIPTEDQHVGDQILHKLKKNKKNKTELDHHALEGFCKGLDISNLNRTFRMFTDKTRFDAAVKREAGREEIRKEIANILDLSGEVDRGEVVTQVNLLLHLLGHHVDSRVADQHHALIHIIQHVEAWLTEPVLAKIYGTEAKEADFTMDYEKIGDSVLKVSDKNLKPFLNRIKTDGIDDVEVKVGDLLELANVTAELEHNPGDLREQIENLFNVKGTVTKPKLEERVRQMKKRLKYEIIPPATTIAPIDPYTEIRKEFVDLLDKALANLSPATLAKLYPVAEDAGTKFEWTDAKYKDFGATVLTTVNDKNRAAALKEFDVETLNTSFVGVLPSIKPATLNTDAGRKKVKEQAAALLRLTEPFDAAEITQQVTALKKRLGDGTVEAAKFAEVADRLDVAAAQLTAAGVIDKLFPPEEDTGTKFEWTDAKYKDFGATVLTTVKPKNQAEALKGFDEAVFNATFNAILPAVKPAALATEPGRNKIKEQAVALFRLSEPFDAAEVNQQADALRTKMTVSPSTPEADTFRDRIDKAEDALTETGVIEKLFEDGGTKFEWTGEKYKNFGATLLGTINDKNRAEALGKFDFIDFEREMGTLKDEESIKDQFDVDAEELKKDIYSLFDLSGTVTDQKLQARAQLLINKLGLKESDVSSPSSDADSKQIKLGKFIFQAAAVLIQTDLVGKLFVKEEGAFVWEYEQFGANIFTRVNDKNRQVALKSFDIDRVNTTFAAILPSIKPATLNTDAGRKKIREQAAALLRLTEPFDAAEVTQQATALKKRLGDGTVEAAKFAEISGRIDVAVAQLTTSGVIDKLFPPEEDTGTKFEWTDAKYKDFGATVLTTVKPKNQAEALKGFDEDTFDATFNLLTPTPKIGLLDTTDGKKRVKSQLIALFKVEEPFEASDIDRQADTIRKRLGLVKASPATHPLDERLQAIVGVLNADMVNKLFAGVSPVGPDNFVSTFRDLETADEVAAYIRGYKSSNFRGHFAYLVDSDEMNEVVRHGAPEDKSRAKAQVREFVGQDIGNVRLTALQAVLKEFEDQIKLVPESSLSVPDQARHQALVKDLADVKKVLETEDGLNRLFKGEKVEAVEPKLNQLGKQIYALSDKELESYLEKLSDMGPDMITRFTAIKDPTLKTGRAIPKPEAARIKKALAELLGVQPKSALTFADVRSLVTAIAAKLQSPAITMQLQKNPKAATGQQLIVNNLSHALNNLDDNVLKQVY